VRWVGDKRAILRFVLVLGALLAAFNVCFVLWIVEGSFFEGYLSLYAKATAAILTVFGDDAVAAGNSVVSPAFFMSIKVGCDAVRASAFFVFAMLAAPSSVPLVSRLPYVGLGILLLAALNLLRIVSLYYTGVYFPQAFEVMHVDVWQVVFIFVPLVMWIAWSRRTLPATARA
jgi:exosortase/archaeosortase family protein